MGVKLTSDMINSANKIEATYGIPSSVLLGQLMQESGGSYPNGLSGLAYNYNNFFGIKGVGTNGTVAMGSPEQGKNGFVTQVSGFKKHKTVYDSFVDYAKIVTKPRYTKYTKDANSIEDYVKGIKSGGYATDDNYVSKVMNLIYSNNLTQYDLANRTGMDKSNPYVKQLLANVGNSNIKNYTVNKGQSTSGGTVNPTLGNTTNPMSSGEVLGGLKKDFLSGAIKLAFITIILIIMFITILSLLKGGDNGGELSTQ